MTLYRTIEELTETVERQAATIRRQASIIRQLQQIQEEEHEQDNDLGETQGEGLL